MSTYVYRYIPLLTPQHSYVHIYTTTVLLLSSDLGIRTWRIVEAMPLVEILTLITSTKYTLKPCVDRYTFKEYTLWV